MEDRPVPETSRMRSALHCCSGWAPILPPILPPRAEDAVAIAVTSNAATVAASPPVGAEGALAGCVAAE